MKLRNVKIQFLAVLSIGCCWGQATESNLSDFNENRIGREELLQWRKWGRGESLSLGEQLCIREAEPSQGIMLISPLAYSGDLILRFKTQALTPATVIAIMLYASDQGSANHGLSLPENYDGNFRIWDKEKDSYFFAFKNAPHNKTPFVVKYAGALPGRELAAAPENYMLAGKYYAVEIGKIGNTLWMSIDNERVFEATDGQDPLHSGRMAFRVRGTAGFRGAALFKEFSIYTKE